MQIWYNKHDYLLKGALPMKSKVVYTEETDFMEDAAEEILEGFSDFPLQSNSLAIVFAEDVVDYPELYRYLSAEWDFPVIGCTALGMLNGSGNGFSSSGINVMLLTGAKVTEKKKKNDEEKK